AEGRNIWSNITPCYFSARPAVGIVWVKLDRRCRVVEYSNTPCSRLMEMCLWVIPDYGHKLN
ncbi:Os09g0129800, partial [Oryza sativa Japonica Group]